MIDGFSELADHIKTNNVQAVEVLMDEGQVTAEVVNAYDNMQHTPLLLSLLYERFDIARLLLKVDGIDYYHQGYLTGTPLSLALCLGASEIAAELIKKETSFQPGAHPDLWFCAVGSSCTACIDVLLAAGLSIDEPLKAGTWREHPSWVWSVAEDYLADGFSFPLDESDYYNDIFRRKALIYAEENEDEAMIDYLKTKDANQNRRRPAT